MRPRVEWLVLSLALLPLAVDLVVGLVTGAWLHAHGDVALIELGVLNASSGEQLWGPYSRFQWHHPGPMVFYLLAPLYALAGRASAAVAAGGLLVALAAGFGLIRDVGRVVSSPRGRLVAALLLAGALVLPLGPERLRAPAWNPVIIIVPFAWLAVLSGRLARGEARALPWIVGVHALIVQTHLGFTPAATALAGAGLVLGRRGVSRHIARIAFGVLVLAWALPIWETFRADVGNPLKLLVFFVLGKGPPSAPLGDVFSVALGPIGGMVGGGALLVATAWAARRSVLAQVALVGLVGGLVALLGVRGPAMPHLFTWVVPLAWWAWGP